MARISSESEKRFIVQDPIRIHDILNFESPGWAQEFTK
jgi:hypothetical protein